MSASFSQPVDLTDPVALAKECESLAGGMDQQAIASQSGTALGGHPSPGFFYGYVASVLRASAILLKSKPESAPLPAPVPAPEPTPVPASAPKKESAKPVK